MPLVSVVMPVYNCRPYLADAIDSVRGQSMADFELLIVDDGSTDGSSEIMDLAAANDPRVRIIRRPNTGLVGALNDGLAAACGTFIARMDADDVCAPNRFEIQVRFLQENETCGAVGGAVDLIDPAGRRLKTLCPNSTHDEIVAELLSGNGGALIHPAVMFRASALAEARGYDPEFKGYGEDWDIFIRMSKLGRVANVRDVLLRYRMHPHSYNHTRRGEQIRKFLKAVNHARGQHNLAPIVELPWTRSIATSADAHRLWAEWAIEGAEYRAARWHSFVALLHGPFDRSAWRFLKYTAGLKAN